jgi:5-methylcytosine-specific restriction endonuclease McrA
MSKVFVLDTKKSPLAPTHPARARQLLKKGKAAVYRKYPFTIILKREISQVDAVAKVVKQSQSFRLKIDPGSKTTGLAILNDNPGEIIWAAELQHRGQQIKKSLEKRCETRRSRRNRKTRYRRPRFNNRTRPKGWLPPSLMSHVYNIQTWVVRLRKLCPITAISLELVKFDTQAMQNPEISGVFYQQGTLFGYEVREYLLEKFGRKCAYCGKENIPDLEVEHIIPKTRGGSNRVGNLTIACKKCNLKKGNRTAEEFGYPEIQEQAKKPLKDAAAVNATRWEIYRRLQATGLPIEVGTGGRTKFNRIKKGLPKTHWLDAVCVGASTPETIKVEGVQPLGIVATGHGSRQMCRVDRYGFPRTKAKQKKCVHGFQTGDIVKAIVPEGKKAGTYIGCVAIRTSGSFNLKTETGIQGVNYRYCHLLQHADGYNYKKKRGTALPPTPLNGVGFRA